MHQRHFAISIANNNRSESILAILQQETPREIMLFLIENPGAAQREISKYVPYSSPPIKWHLSRLIAKDIVYNYKESKLIKCYLKANVNDIITLMKFYHPSIWSKLYNRLAEIFIELSSMSNLYNLLTPTK